MSKTTTADGYHTVVVTSSVAEITKTIIVDGYPTVIVAPPAEITTPAGGYDNSVAPPAETVVDVTTTPCATDDEVHTTTPCAETPSAEETGEYTGDVKSSAFAAGLSSALAFVGIFALF